MSRVKTLDGPRVRVVSPVVKEKVYGGKDLLKSQVLSSEWNIELVREDASGDSEDGEDDELPCVIEESAGDCVWRGSRRSVGSSFHREGAAAYLKERFVIFKEDISEIENILAMATHMSIRAEFHWNPFTKYRDTA